MDAINYMAADRRKPTCHIVCDRSTVNHVDSSIVLTVITASRHWLESPTSTTSSWADKVRSSSACWCYRRRGPDSGATTLLVLVLLFSATSRDGRQWTSRYTPLAGPILVIWILLEVKFAQSFSLVDVRLLLGGGQQTPSLAESLTDLCVVDIGTNFSNLSTFNLQIDKHRTVTWSVKIKES